MDIVHSRPWLYSSVQVCIVVASLDSLITVVYRKVMEYLASLAYFLCNIYVFKISNNIGSLNATDYCDVLLPA